MTDTVQMMADAYRLKTAIESETVEIEENGIKVIIGGDLKVKEISVNNLQNDTMKDIVNKAIRKAQEIMVLKMKEMSVAKDVS
jgi:DNA-binding protein YbaB